MDRPSNAQIKYIKSHRRHKLLVIVLRIAILTGAVALWEFAAKYGYIDDFIFCSPSEIFKTGLDMCADKSLFHHLFITIYETLLSFFLVTVISIAVAIIMWFCRILTEISEPYLVVLNSLPKSALAPVLIVWLGNTPKTIIITAVSVAVFGTIISLYTGFNEVDTDKIKLIRTLGGKKRHIMCKVLIPFTVPIIISSMKVNIGLALVGVIIGEFLAANAGLGYLIIYGSQVFKMDLVLMSIVILCILAALLYLMLSVAEKLIIRKLF